MNRNMFFVFLGIFAFAAGQGSSEFESCWTPSLDSGVCISIHECPSLLKLLRRLIFLNPGERSLLMNSHCGYKNIEPKVCCPQIPMMSRSRPDSAPMSTFSTNNEASVEVTYSPPDVKNHPKLKLINDEKCGAITQPRIISGNKTAMSEFPWMALIAYNIDGVGTSFKCGGSLINKRYVLTAAHCVTGLKAGVILAGVRIGEHDLRTEIDCEVEDGVVVFCADQYQNFFVERFHYHSGYNKEKHENDIALIRMDGEAQFKSLNIKPICLPVGDSAVIRFKKAIVTGWGRTETGQKSKELLQARLELVPNKECAEIYRPSNIPITDKQLCAGGKDRVDSCFGDSGGPLQYPDVMHSDVPRYVQYGVVSFGPEDCGLPGYPGVYTKISFFMDWILNTIRE